MFMIVECVPRILIILDQYLPVVAAQTLLPRRRLLWLLHQLFPRTIRLIQRSLCTVLKRSLNFLGISAAGKVLGMRQNLCIIPRVIGMSLFGVDCGAWLYYTTRNNSYLSLLTTASLLERKKTFKGCDRPEGKIEII